MEKSVETPAKRPRFRVQFWQVAGLLLLVGVAGLLGFAFWPGEEQADEERAQVEVAEQKAEIHAVVLEPVSFPLRVDATGHLQAWRTAEVSAELSGRIVKRHVKEGQRVAAGTVLFELDKRDFELELEEARAEWLKMQAEYAVRYGDDTWTAEADSSALTEARQQLAEAEKAFAAGQITRDELDNSRRMFEGKRIQQPALRKAIQAANIGLTQAEQRKLRAELAMERTRIVAPFAGRIADIKVEEGQRIGAGQQVAMLLDDHRMKVDVDVLESNIVQIKQGVTAQVKIPSLGNRTFTGTIHALNPMVDPQTGAGRVTIAIPNRDGSLIAGLFTYAYLEADRLTDRLVLPTDAVLVRQGRDLVFRVEEGEAQWVYVTVGARSGDHVEIVEGLAPGDTIATAGHFALAHDTPVVVKSATASFVE